MNTPNAFTFVENTQDFKKADTFTARVAGNIRTSQQLFELLYGLLKLPGYFGFNWNALFDCLRDFHWIAERNVAIVHDDLPKLPKEEMRTYLEILRDAIVDWKLGEIHSLQVVFDEKDRSCIQEVMEE